MKFTCDYCKTRYTIADERVRGKVVKLRCKTCTQVITVRGDSDGQPRAAASETKSPVHDAPSAELPAERPDEQLEDEWFVSLDGDQTGPLSLGQAQAWVAGRPATDDLYCWTEGFDDWLPVEKVNHFRGLRTRKVKARPATLPPPIPAIGKREENKSLFASTIAGLEADGAAAAAEAAKLPPLRVNPRAATPPPVAPGIRKSPASQASPASMFDTGGRAGTESEVSDADGGSAFDAIVAAGAAAHRNNDDGDGGDDDDDDDLDIGEVSRVVRIADLAKQAARPRVTAAAQPVPLRNTGAIGAGIVIHAGNTGMISKVPGVAYMGGSPLVEISSPSAPARNTAVYWLAGGLLVALLAAIIAVVVTQGPSADSGGTTIAGGEYDQLGRRYDDPLRKLGSGAGSGSAAGAVGSGSATPSTGSGKNSGGNNGTKPVNNNGSGGTSGSATPELGSDGNPLKSLNSEDIETMSRKMSAGTTRCWEQAQKKDMFIDAKRVKVTLVVDKSGTVSQVSLSDFSTDYLGQCLISAVKRWSFGKSTNGITAQFTLAFTK